MPGNYSHTTRTDGTVLTSAIYNTDHTNHINNAIPAQHDDYSVDLAQMRLTTDPGEVGSESQPTSLAGELERLRFTIAEVKTKLLGTAIAQWYTSVTDNRRSLIGISVFTASGTWTKPTGCNAVEVQVLGGGGGSGGTDATGASESAASAGGGGGGYTYEFITSGLGATESVTVGAAGAAGASGNNAGGAGGTSSFGSHASATGGGGGGGAVTGSSIGGIAVGGTGGVGSGGNVNIEGSKGGRAYRVAGSLAIGGAGGGSVLGGHGSPTAGGDSAAGGLNFGGGATGRSSASSTGAAGGAGGAAGIIIVKEYT